MEIYHFYCAIRYRGASVYFLATNGALTISGHVHFSLAPASAPAPTQLTWINLLLYEGCVGVRNQNTIILFIISCYIIYLRSCAVRQVPLLTSICRRTYGIGVLKMNILHFDRKSVRKNLSFFRFENILFSLFMWIVTYSLDIEIYLKMSA